MEIATTSATIAVSSKISLQMVWEEYTLHKRLKPTTLKGYRNTINRCFADWLDKPVAELSKKDICDRHREISARTPALANLAMRLLRALLTFAGYHWDELKDLAVFNPVRILKAYSAWNRIEPRRRVILPHQMPAWFAAVYIMRRATIRDYLLLVLFTGLRREEASRLRWKDVSFQNRSLFISDTKNGRAHEIPMCSQVVELLENRRREQTPSEWVFPGATNSEPISNWSRAQHRVTEVGGVFFTVHDLRRTYATVAFCQAISSDTIKRLLNHSMDDVTSRHYIAPAVEPLREPAQRIVDEICRQAEICFPCGSILGTELPYWRWPEIPSFKMPGWFEDTRKFPVTVRDYLILTLLLGLRRTDATRLRWEDVDLTRRVITVRESKNGTEYELPLSDQALDLLRDRRSNAKSKWVFQSEFHGGHISGVSVTQTDLRATFKGVAKDIGTKHRDVKGLLGQHGADATLSVESLRRPIQRIADEMFREAGICCWRGFAVDSCDCQA